MSPITYPPPSSQRFGTEIGEVSGVEAGGTLALGQLFRHAG